MKKSFLNKVAVGVMALSLLGAFAPVTTPEVVVADEVEFVGSKTSNGVQDVETQTPTTEDKPKVSKLEPIDDTLPF